MKYSCDVKEKHQKKMSMQTELISNEMRIPQKPFPENSSKEVVKELQFLLNYNNGVIDENIVEKGDKIEDVFENYCKNNNLNFDEDYYKKIMKESSKTILSMKYHYNRPRPYQLGEYYGIEDFKIHNIDSANTPSYPSGHTTQAHIMSELLGRQYPHHYDNLKELANFISNSRLMARVHYPSDIKFGEEVAQHILGKVIQKKND